MQQFTMLTPYVQYYINGNEEEYRGVYLDDNNYYMFSSNLGVDAMTYVQQNKIETDVSLMPFSEVEQ